MALLSNATSEAAVDEWFRRFPALLELEEEFVWFRSMNNTVARRLLSEASWGAQSRLYVGAFLSIMDLGSDFVMVVKFLQEDEDFYAMAILTTIGSNLSVQVFLACIQNKKLGITTQVYEVVLVLLGLKPAVDAMRVASGQEKNPDLLMDPFAELTFGKVIETLFEAVPAGILQLYALIQAERVSKVAVASLFTACCCIAFTSATISFDWDVSPAKRKETPQVGEVG